MKINHFVKKFHGLKGKKVFYSGANDHMSTSNVGLCEQKHRFVNPHLNDHSFSCSNRLSSYYQIKNFLYAPLYLQYKNSNY